MTAMSIRVYCINLKERPDRWSRFSKQPGFQRIKETYKFERFEGINGKLLDIKNDERVSLRTKRNIMYQKRRDHEDLDTAGGVGCYLSHYGTWKRFLESGASHCIIFEDDALIPDNFLEIFEAAREDLAKPAVIRPDIWLLSKPFGPALSKALDLEKLVYEGNWAYGVSGTLTGYILTREAALILVENALPIDGHVDHFMRRCAQMGMLVIGHNSRIILFQTPLKKKDSDIQEKEKCIICDLPDNLDKKGYAIFSNTTIASLAVGFAIVSLLLALHKI